MNQNNRGNQDQYDVIQAKEEFESMLDPRTEALKTEINQLKGKIRQMDAATVSREARWEKYGFPTRLADDIEGKVLVFAHGSREGAEDSARANREEYGHPCHVERRYETWVTVVDIRPRIEQIERELRE